MPHFICRWPGGDVLLASVESRQELDTILQERCEPGVCKVARYHGPLVLELKPDVPGVSRTSVERFVVAPPCPSFQPAWDTRQVSGDVDLLAADGSRQRVHKLVLQCRLPVLQGQDVAAAVEQVRLQCVPDAPCLLSLVQFMYLDDVQQPTDLTPQLHLVALASGLQRLVGLCEARFAQQLEVQLSSWQGLNATQQDDVLDSFIGWCMYSEQLQRQELRSLCVHALARHVAAAQARASWSSLSEATASLVQLIAASTAPPLVHRQIVHDGAAVLPAGHNPSAAGTARTTPGAPVVSVDAEAFAAAGGRLTTLEWQQLQKFRAAVSSSLQQPEASPLVLQQQHLIGHSLAAAAQPCMAFSVKQPVLGPHKRLMDSVCRFAFPATHGLLGCGWQLTGCSQGTAAAAAAAVTPATAAAGGVASVATPRPAGVAPVSAAMAAAVATPTAAAAAAQVAPGSPAASALWQQQPPAPELVAAAAVSSEATAADAVVPVPVPSAEPLAAIRAAAAAAAECSANMCSQPSLATSAAAAVAAAAVAAQEATEHSNSSTSSATQQPIAAVLGEHCSSRASSSAGSITQAPGTPIGLGRLQQAHAPGTPLSTSGSPCISHNGMNGMHTSNGVQNVVTGQALGAGRYLLRNRIQSAGNSAGLRLSHLRTESRSSWGSGVSESQAAGHHRLEQQQVLGAVALPLARLRVLRDDEGSGSWGSGITSLQSSKQSSPLYSGLAGLNVQHWQHQQQQQQQSVDNQRLSQLGTAEIVHRSAQQHQGLQQSSEAVGQPEPAAVDEERRIALGFRTAYQQLQQQEQQQQTQTGQAQCNVAAAQEPQSWPMPGNAEMQGAKLLDVPALYVPGGSSGPDKQGQAAVGVPSTQVPSGNGGVAAPGAHTAEPATAVPPQSSVPAAAAVHGGVGAVLAPAAAPKFDTLAALQRALVEDFVLYEEASAARQHVVGILVSIEQGDHTAGQRLLAPACAELIAATAPAVVAHHGLAAPNSATSGSSSASEAAVKAAMEYCRTAKGISKLLGMASISRAAVELLPTQLEQQQQQLLRALQRIGSQLPGLSRLLSLYPSAGADSASTPSAAVQHSPAAAEGEAAAPHVVPEHVPVSPGPFARAALHAAVLQRLPLEQHHQQQLLHNSTTALPVAAAADKQQAVDLEGAIAALLSLPELAQSMPVLLTQEQYLQRQLLVQQLASRAAAVIAADGSSEHGNAVQQAAAAELPVSAGAVGSAPATAVGPRDVQAGLLFSSILASLGAVAATPTLANSNTAATAPVVAASTGRMQGRFAPGITQFSGFAGAGTGMMGRPGSAVPPVMHFGPLGLLGAGGAPGPADGLMASATGGTVASASGMFTPTGAGAMLAGGLLAEGGVAGDSVLDDMAADVLFGGNSERRITCHGMFELCAALARPVSDTGAVAAEAQQQQHETNGGCGLVAHNVSNNKAAAEGQGVQVGLTGHKRQRSSSSIEEQPAGQRR